MTKIDRIPPLAIVCGLLALLPGAPARSDGHWPERPLSTLEPVAEPRRGALTEAEMEMARIAWRYFEANTQAGTGLANAAHAFPSATLWDTGSYLGAVVSAHGLGLIGEAEAGDRLDRVLATLGSLDLFRQDCPNKVYNTETSIPTNYVNEPGEVGCSALDIARLLVWLRIVEQRYPEREEAVRAILPRWNWCELVRDGLLHGAAPGEGDEVRWLQEGRLGYEEYGARALGVWGFDTGVALDPEPWSAIWMYGVEVPYDQRDPRLLGAQNYVVTESYALWGLEFGWDDPAGEGPGAWVARAAQNIYEVQARRREATDILTARTEHQLLEAPFFVYDTIFSGGRPWATITDQGEPVPQQAAVALKGALGLWALWETDYGSELFDYVAPQFDAERGFFEGVFEDGRGPIAVQTANNNGIMLETLLFKQEGPILRPVADPAAWTEGIDPAQGRCLPGSEEASGD